MLCCVVKLACTYVYLSIYLSTYLHTYIYIHIHIHIYVYCYLQCTLKGTRGLTNPRKLPCRVLVMRALQVCTELGGPPYKFKPNGEAGGLGAYCTSSVTWRIYNPGAPPSLFKQGTIGNLEGSTRAFFRISSRNPKKLLTVFKTGKASRLQGQSGCAE